MKAVIKHILVFTGVFITGFGVGHLTGTKPLPEHVLGNNESTLLKHTIDLRDQEIANLLSKMERLTQLATQEVVAAAGIEIPQPVDDGAVDDEAVPLDQVNMETTEALSALQAMVQNPALFDDELASSLQARLYNMVATDPHASQEILNAFMLDPNSEMGQMLAAVLGQFKDHAIEAAAMQLAAHGSSPDERIAGLSLLQRLDIDNPESRQLVFSMIDNETDTEVLKTALYSLNPGVVSPQESRQILASLNRHLTSSDAEIRRRSVIAYSEWVSTSNSAQPVVEALFDDSVDVRAGAAFALGKAPYRSLEIRDALIDRISDTGEDWAVRNQAWMAVKGFEMDERTHQIFEEFRSQRDRIGEAGSG